MRSKNQTDNNKTQNCGRQNPEIALKISCSDPKAVTLMGYHVLTALLPEKGDSTDVIRVTCFNFE